MSRPDDLITLREAAAVSDRSLSSLRNWTRDGQLPLYRQDDVRKNSPVMVSRRDLMVLLATSKSAHPGGPRVPNGSDDAGQDRGAMLAAVTAAERDGLRAVVEAQRQTIAALEQRCSDIDARAHSERLRADDYRSRIVALEAELNELRSWARLPLYRRLLSAPPLALPMVTGQGEETSVR